MKTEHEKLLAGEDYDYRDPEIQQMIVSARKRVRRLNGTDDPAEQHGTVEELLGQMDGRAHRPHGSVQVHVRKAHPPWQRCAGQHELHLSRLKPHHHR
ncbi:maltose acetyltransferase domain-containing protein [Olsenella sp. Marseille-P4559]|uniref:maltose acetyltransferase domain-containing protein n=1 Tax=Olsenella sp. Marseille-P4559 TaxID=2364795 RepID=UPI001A92E943